MPSPVPDLTFLPISHELEFDCTNYDAVSEVLMPVIEATLDRNNVQPWSGYLALTKDEEVVGICAFKSPPDENDQIELAWFTFPPYENQGHGTRMARYLVESANQLSPASTLIAHTEPEVGPSSKICERIGFTNQGQVDLPEEGPVWRWQK